MAEKQKLENINPKVKETKKDKLKNINKPAPKQNKLEAINLYPEVTKSSIDTLGNVNTLQTN